MSANGQWLAAFSGPSNLVYVFDRTLTNVAASFGPHKEAEDIAISNNGRWVGTGSYADQSVRIWDVAKNRSLSLAVRVGPRPQAAFSADGKWVATFGDKFELRRQGSWELARPLIFPESQPVLGAAAFSLDSRFLAVVGNLNSVHLFDLETFESVAIFRASNAIRLRALAFSPDQTKLAAIGSRRPRGDLGSEGNPRTTRSTKPGLEVIRHKFVVVAGNGISLWSLFVDVPDSEFVAALYSSSWSRRWESNPRHETMQI